MKIFRLTSVLVLSVFFVLSCSKDDAKKGVDCFGESLLFDIKHDTDAGNVKIKNFTIEYAGEKTLGTSVKWDFGDGQNQTVTGMTATHTYTAAGTYHAKVTVKIPADNCSLDIKETVNVN